MGKSKRIRAERARSIASNPEKYASSAKNNGSKKSKIATIVIIALVAALLLGAIAGTIIVNTGSVLRWQNALSSENYHITGAMYAYMFYNTYNTYYTHNTFRQRYSNRRCFNSCSLRQPVCINNAYRRGR